MRVRIAAVLALSAAPFIAPAAHADNPLPEGAAPAGAFLERQLAAGDHVFDYPGTDQPDIGVTIDAVLALAATHTGPEEIAAARAAIVADSGTYLGPGLAATELYAGPVAKTALLAETTGADPRSFAGRDLVADLTRLQRADGRYADRTAYTDTSNTFTQALALLALARAGEPASRAGTEFLLAQQCSDGGFRLYPDESACVSDNDASALAADALLALDLPADRVLDHLAAELNADGGLTGGVGTAVANANSTGLAASAFAAGGREADFTRAAGFLRSLQLGCSTPIAVRGAIAYDADSYAALVAAGTGAQAGDQERRATAQAAFGLSGTSFLAVTTAGAQPGSDGCTPDGTTTTTTSSTTTSSPASSSSSTTSSTSTPAATTVTVTTTLPPVIPPPAPADTVTVTVTADNPPDTDNQTSQAEASGPPSSTDSASAMTTSAPTPSTTTATAPTSIAVAAARPSDSTGTGALPYALAGSLVALGAAAAAYILRKGRTP